MVGSMLYNMCDLKAIEINMQSSLMNNLMFYVFKLGCNTTKATENTFWAKGEGAVDYNTVTRWFKKFYLGCKNLDDQTRSGMSITVYSEVILQAIKASLTSSTLRILTNLAFHSTMWFVTFTTLAKIFRAAKSCLMLPQYCKTFDFP